MRAVLSNGAVWAIGFCFIPLYVVRFGIEGWVASYFSFCVQSVVPGSHSHSSAVPPSLGESPGARQDVVDMAQSATVLFLFWWQVGGFAGSLTVGPLSDIIFKGKRGPMAVLCAVVATMAMAALPEISLLLPTLLTPGTARAVAVAVVPGWSGGGGGGGMGGMGGTEGTEGSDLLASSAVITAAWVRPALAFVGVVSGFCVFGQRGLLTLASRGAVPAKDGGKADAIANALAELGGVLAGAPLIYLIQASDWTMFTRTLLMAAVVMCAGCVVLLVVETRRGGGGRRVHVDAASKPRKNS